MIPPRLHNENSRLEDIHSRSWSPIPLIGPDSGSEVVCSRLREDFSDGGSWKSYERNRNDAPVIPVDLDEVGDEGSDLVRPVGISTNQEEFSNDTHFSKVGVFQTQSQGSHTYVV
jgi:hypothetical protein